jgi:hypothetical protein
MLCCPLDGHERFRIAIQAIQKVLGERKAVFGCIGHVYCEYLFARLTAFCVEEFNFIRIPTGELEA